MGSTYASAGHSRCLRKQLCARVDAYPFCGSTFGGSDFVSILAEIKTAGFSGGGLIAVIAGGLLLGSGWYGGNVAWFEFLLYFGGIALILWDIFVLVSGFGVAAGILSMTAGLYFTFGGDMTALWVLSAAMILAIIGIYFWRIICQKIECGKIISYIIFIFLQRICFFCSEFEEV